MSTGRKKISGSIKIHHYSNKKLGVVSSINEAVITVTLKEIEDIDGKNEQRTTFINDRIRKNLNRNGINVVFVRISRSDGAEFIKLKGKVEKIAPFVVDIIYSHPLVYIVTLPHIEFLNNDSSEDFVEFDNLIGARISEIASLGRGGGKIGNYHYHTIQEMEFLNSLKVTDRDLEKTVCIYVILMVKLSLPPVIPWYLKFREK